MCIRDLVSKLFCVELCVDYRVVWFAYRWSIQSVVSGGSIGSRGVFIVVFM